MITESERALLREMAEDERSVIAVANAVGWTGPDLLDVAAGAMRAVGHGMRPVQIATGTAEYRVLGTLSALTARTYDAVAVLRGGGHTDPLRESREAAADPALAVIDDVQQALDRAGLLLVQAHAALARAHSLSARD